MFKSLESSHHQGNGRWTLYEQLCPLVGVHQESATGLVEMSHYLFKHKHALREHGISGPLIGLPVQD